ncbi:hypothetical protein BDV19DRAFT_356189 [Aspergillus venezuelensis]
MERHLHCISPYDIVVKLALKEGSSGRIKVPSTSSLGQTRVGQGPNERRSKIDRQSNNPAIQQTPGSLRLNAMDHGRSLPKMSRLGRGRPMAGRLTIVVLSMVGLFYGDALGCRCKASRSGRWPYGSTIHTSTEGHAMTLFFFFS